MFFNSKATPSTKEGIAKFLAEHPRYQTSSSVRPLTSYAHCVKLHRLGLNKSEMEKATSILETDDYWSELKWSLREFQRDMQGRYEISPMGRQSGYLVLFESEVYDPGYKSTCSRCGQLNFQPVSQHSNKCGVCGSPRANLKKPLEWTRIVGSGLDHGVTYVEMLDWSMDMLRSRVDVVRSFDAACDKTRNAFIRLLNEYMMVEQIIMVPKSVKRLERIA